MDWCRCCDQPTISELAWHKEDLIVTLCFLDIPPT